MKRLLVVDDHPAIRAGVVEMLSGQPDIAIVGEVGTGAAALAFSARERPDLALIDIRLPDMDGVDLIAELMRASPALRTIAFSSYCKAEIVRRTIAAGASGFLLKDATPRELREAVRSVLAGRRAFAAEASRVLVEAGPPPDLTPRELSVLACMVDGLSTKDISLALDMAEGTVGVHIGHVLGKLGVPSRARAVALANALGLVSPGHLPESR